MSSETITRNDLTNIFNEVLPTTSVNYVVETHIEPLTIATNAYVEATFTATKSGYFPLGIVGYRIGWVSGETGKCNIYSIEMTDKNEGSVTVTYAVYNTTSASVSMNLKVDILWAKVDGASVSLQADYVVEEGTSGIWTYRKWNSGVAECWGRADNITVPSGWSSTGVNLGLPFTFLTMTNWQTQHQNWQISNCYGYPTTISNTYDNINIQTYSSEAMSSAIFMVLCQGTWK